jgi:hypothetical protein
MRSGSHAGGQIRRGSTAYALGDPFLVKIRYRTGESGAAERNGVIGHGEGLKDHVWDFHFPPAEGFEKRFGHLRVEFLTCSICYDVLCLEG